MLFCSTPGGVYACHIAYDCKFVALGGVLDFRAHALPGGVARTWLCYCLLRRKPPGGVEYVICAHPRWCVCMSYRL